MWVEQADNLESYVLVWMESLQHLMMSHMCNIWKQLHKRLYSFLSDQTYLDDYRSSNGDFVILILSIFLCK